MEKHSALTMFDSLSADRRLEAFRLLVRHEPKGMNAGAIADALEVTPSNLSFHLKALVQAGLVTVESRGRYQRYRANLESMFALIAYLTDECCGAALQDTTDLTEPTDCLPTGCSRAATDHDAGRR